MRSGPHMAPKCLSQRTDSPSLGHRPWLWQDSVLAVERHQRETLASYCSSISHWGKQGHWQQAVFVLCQLIARRLEANVIIFNATVHACEQGDRWSNALNLLNDARKRGLQWDEFSCGSAVNSCQGLWPRAFSLLRLHACNAGFSSHHVITTSATRACAAQAAWPSALHLQEHYAASGGQSDLVLGNAAIQAIHLGGGWEKTARLVYQLLRQSLQVNARTYLPAMSSYSPERWPAVLQLLSSMETQTSGNLLLCTSVVSACGSSWQRALHCFRETKQRWSADVIMYNSALSACAEGGEWECALCLLKEIGDVKLERSIVSYNAALSACAAGSQWLLALHILEIALKSGLQGSLASFTATMDACAESKRWETVLRLFVQLRQSFIDLDAGAYSSVLNALNHAATSRWSEGLDFLQEMQKRRLRRESRLCNAALRAFQRQSGAFWNSALQLFANFQAQHVLADAIGVNVMTNSFTAGAQWRRSIRTVRHLLDGSMQANEVSYSSLIRATEITASWHAALKYLLETREEGLQGSAIEYNAAISACASREAWERALLCLVQMIEAQLLPDLVSYNSAMNACVQAEEWQSALSLLQQVSYVKLQCGLVSYNTAMSACASGGQWQLALSFLALLQQLRQADVFSYSAAMAACDSGKQPRRVFSLLAELQSEGIQESVLPFTSAINVFAKGRDWEPALTMLVNLRCRALQQNVVCNNAALGACRGDHWQKAFHLQQSLCRASLQPSAITCSSTISALETVGQWEWAFHLMLRRGVHVNRMAVTAAIRSCGGKQWEWALALLEMLQDLEDTGMAGVESDVVVYNACLSVLQVAAQWQHAFRLLGELHKRSMQATVQTFAAAVGACESGLLAQEAVSLIEQVESTAWLGAKATRA